MDLKRSLKPKLYSDWKDKEALISELLLHSQDVERSCWNHQVVWYPWCYTYLYILGCEKLRKESISGKWEKEIWYSWCNREETVCGKQTKKDKNFDSLPYSVCFFKSKQGKCADLSLAGPVVLWGRNITSHCFKYRLSLWMIEQREVTESK